jgi:squalene-associated FAD-dependent desaturase
MTGTVHVIGAGLAGLSAAVKLAGSGNRVVVHEATAHPGGRCRTYYDHATDLMIDNGNHLLLSGNKAALSYLDAIGTRDKLIAAAGAEFPFADVATGERWSLQFGATRLPWWILHKARRVPGTRIVDYLALARLLRPTPGKTVCEVVPCTGPLYERLLNPLIVAALNIEPQKGSAALASAIIRETFGAGGPALRPLVARDGLGPVLVEPAVDFLRQKGMEIRLNHELRAVETDSNRVVALTFEDGAQPLEPDDAVIMATPPYGTASLLPSVSGPNEFRAILNAHFRIEPPEGFPRLIGVLNGMVEWIFAFPGRLSVTISNADRYMQMPREGLAKSIWQEVSQVTGVAGALPRWQIVRERRATFAATPEQDQRRPRTRTVWTNLFLAGDWTATGLPATIEGAVRSGQRAAELVVARNQG